jgi:pimeloyl-ACP methyl ester carboxylesterase
MPRAIPLPIFVVACLACGFTRAAADDVSLSATNLAGKAVKSLVDGDTIQLHAALASPARRSTDIVFRLDAAGQQIARCLIPRGGKTCETTGLRALGWYWDDRGTPRPSRTISAETTDRPSASIPVRIAPRPVVFVHGFLSDHKTWAAYTAPGGFLTRVGLKGFAVGDGNADGLINSGDITRPRTLTKTLPENAAALAAYIAGVKKATHAEMVDLVAHSMGGLISRYYIARLMQGRDVAQLMMLGSPHGGSECSGLAAALGVLGPAALELRPAYLRQIFNRSVTRRNGVPFHMLAGNPIVENFKAPCSGVPSDGVVSVDSASAIPGSVTRMSVLHTDMTRSEDVFSRFVLPQLRRRAGDFPIASDPQDLPDSSVPTQFTQVFSGHVEAGGAAEVEVNLDQVVVASFALFDPSRSLVVTVRGASGSVIALNPEEHGLIKVDDPSSLVTLGYGFRNPRPGPWRITLRAPPQAGADFALSARVVGGASLQARSSQLTPARGQPVTLAAALEYPGKPLTDVSMRALIHLPSGRTETLDLQGSAAEMRAVWRAAERGIHGVDIIATARADGLRIERTTFLALDVQP